jgi:hypothetical protein
LVLDLDGDVLRVTPVRRPELFATRAGLPVYLGELPDDGPEASE